MKAPQTKQSCLKSPATNQQRSFDISVNLLNNQVLSDKLLWKNVTGDIEKPQQQEVQEAMLQPALIPCRHKEMPIIFTLLTLPFTCLVAVLVLLLYSTHKPFVSTVVGCAIVLGTPALLLLCQQLGAVKKHMHLHILLIHEGALLLVLNKSFLSFLCLIFVFVFVHLSVQSGSRKPFCFFIAITNAANILLFENAIPFAGNSEISVDVLTGSIVLLSAVAYAVHALRAC